MPVTTIVGAGRIARVQMEHVWVEAALDYFPSRAGVNQSADSWIPLDPSFKQYEYIEGIDVAAVTGTDPEALAQSFLDSGAVNDSEGRVSSFDPTIPQSAQGSSSSGQIRDLRVRFVCPDYVPSHQMPFEQQASGGQPFRRG